MSNNHRNDDYLASDDDLKPGTAEQWDRVRANRNSERAQAAIRNARLCGTDPSWYGF